MSITGSIAWDGWVKLVLSLILFVGPGYALLSLFPGRGRLDATQKASLAAGLALAFWPILFAWLLPVRMVLTPAILAAVMIAGWTIGLIRLRPWRDLRAATLRLPALERVALWLVLLALALAGVLALRAVVVGPGSDAYHHTAITQLIVDRGMLPEDLLPYGPIVTFTYHYGFHTVAAVLASLTGLPPLVIVPVTAQILAAVAALSVAFFVETATGSRLAATAGATVTGMVGVFPAYLINWGRYTQLAGMVLLAFLLAVVWRWSETGWKRAYLLPVGILAAGTSLTHYRVTLMAISGIVLVIGFKLLTDRIGWRVWQRAIAKLIIAGLTAAALAAPWLLHVALTRSQGYPVEIGSAGPSFFSLSRLGPVVLSYPTNGLYLALLAAALIAGLLQRDRLTLGMLLWAGAMLVLSTPRLASEFMDTVTVVISLFFPAAAVVGWGVARVVQRMPASWRAVRGLVWVGLAALAIWGAVLVHSIVEPAAAYVGPDDLEAAAWISDNTPPSARFMINTFHWDFMPDFVIGPDAGYWLPLLAGRQTPAAPMIYSNERAASPDFLSQLVALDRLAGHLTTPEARDSLRSAGITHVYVGQRGGPIAVDELLASAAFALLHRSGRAYVFSFEEATP